MPLPELLQGLGAPPDTQAPVSAPAPQPTPAPFSGTHYAKEKLKGAILHGDKRGMTGEGEDADRVYLPPRGAPAAVHVYENNGQVFGKHPQILSRAHAYHVEGQFSLADIDSEPLWAQAKQEVEQNLQGQAPPDMIEKVARNEAEWKLLGAGYNGYRSQKQPGNVVLFGDVPATSLDKMGKETSALDQTSTAQTDPENPNASSASPDSDATADSDPSPPPGPFSLGFKVPTGPPNAHEDHGAESDPAHLSL